MVEEQKSIQEIRRLTPHRYPFLMVDRILEYVPGDYLIALKNVSINEEYFNGHFPKMPVMPGVLMVEALGQAAGLLLYYTLDLVPGENNGYVFAGANQVRFRKVVEPGDQLKLKVKLIKRKSSLWIFETEATVDEKLACDAELLILQSSKVRT